MSISGYDSRPHTVLSLESPGKQEKEIYGTRSSDELQWPDQFTGHSLVFPLITTNATRHICIDAGLVVVDCCCEEYR